MFCYHCGKQIPDGTTSCQFCGKNPAGEVVAQPTADYQQQYQQAYAQPTADYQQQYQQQAYAQPTADYQQQAYAQPTADYQQQYQQQAYAQPVANYQQQYQQMQYQPEYGVQSQKTRGVIWAKILGFFILWVGAIVNLSNGVSFMSGSMFGSQKELIYKVVDGLEGMMKFVGIYSFLLAALQVVAAICIITKKKLAIILTPASNFALAIFWLLYFTQLSNVFDKYTKLSDEVKMALSAAKTSCMVSMIGCIVVGIINVVYFKNRKDYFNQ